MTMRLFRAMLRAAITSPLNGVIVFLALASGGLAGAYPRTLLASTHPPGLVAGVMLGFVGACGSSVIWAVPWASGISAGASQTGPRAVLFAAGMRQRAVRGAEFAALLCGACGSSVLGAFGGLAAVTAEQIRAGRWNVGMSDAPAVSTVLRVVLVVIVVTTAGFMLGIATSRSLVASTAYAGGLTLTAALAGTAYFAPDFRFAAALSPFGILLDGLRDDVVAPQFSLRPVPTAIYLAGAAFWAALVLACAWMQVRRRVA